VSAFNRFTPEQLDALKRGRAIPFLIEHRGSACPGYTLSVIATLDDQRFCGLFLPEAAPDCELVCVPIEGRMLPRPYPITSDSPDARAIHQLWSDWESGVRDLYLDFFALMGRVLARERLTEALDAVPPPPEPQAPASKARTKPRKAAKSKRSTSSGVRRARS
jgi:hypothetical protein